MDFYQTIADNFQSTIETIAHSVDSIATPLERASQLMTQALLDDHKILACGNGADAAIAQLFCSHMQNRFDQDRPPLPALSLSTDSVNLTAIADSDSFGDIYARQVSALGLAGDILLCINSGSRAENLQRAMTVARDRNMAVIALSNDNDEVAAETPATPTVELRLTASRRSKVLELQLMTINCLCELLDRSLFGYHNQD